jgi:hypothetical protein
MPRAQVESVLAGHLFPLEQPHLVVERAQAMLQAARSGSTDPAS